MRAVDIRKPETLSQPDSEAKYLFHLWIHSSGSNLTLNEEQKSINAVDTKRRAAEQEDTIENASPGKRFQPYVVRFYCFFFADDFRRRFQKLLQASTAAMPRGERMGV